MEPMFFYDAPFCRPPQIVDAVENLGEILSGDRIENSLYEVRERGKREKGKRERGERKREGKREEKTVLPSVVPPKLLMLSKIWERFYLVIE